MESVNSIVGFLIGKYPVFANIGAYSIVLMGGVMALIEACEGVVLLTESKKDDEILGKVKMVAKKMIPVLEMLPHVNLPLAQGALVAVKVMKAIGGAIKGYFS
jgi:hypothetical protein